MEEFGLKMALPLLSSLELPIHRTRSYSSRHIRKSLAAMNPNTSVACVSSWLVMMGEYSAEDVEGVRFPAWQVFVGVFDSSHISAKGLEAHSLENKAAEVRAN